VRALGVSKTTPSPLMPSLMPISDSGVPGFEGASWQGMCAPAATPRPIVQVLSNAVIAAIKAPDTAEAFAKLGIEGIGSTPEEFRAFHKAEIVKWGKAMRDAGIRP